MSEIAAKMDEMLKSFETAFASLLNGIDAPHMTADEKVAATRQFLRHALAEIRKP